MFLVLLFSSNKSKPPSAQQKENTIVKERLEIIEQEKKNLVNDLVSAREQSQNDEPQEKGHGKTGPETQLDTQTKDDTNNTTKINYDLIISSHFDSARLIGLPELSEFHIAIAAAMGQLEEMVERINKMQNAPWEEFITYLQVWI